MIFKFYSFFFMKFLLANRIAPDGMPRSVAFHLGIYCFHMCHKKYARLIIDNVQVNNLLFLLGQIQHFFFSLFFFNSVLRHFQDFFSSYETGQSVGGAKSGEPQEKPPDTPVSYVARARLEPTPDTAVR